MESYITIQRAATFELEDRKSRFIADAAPVETEQEALRFIEDIKKRYPDATHHVYAYVIRENSIMRFTDDREPQGTAGMPVLDAIRKNGCTNAVIVVTRYFGGTLLGTGGLVHAYSASALGALKAANIITYDVYVEYDVLTNYSDYQRISQILAEFDFRQEDIVYADNIKIIGRVRKALEEKFVDKLIQSTSGRAKIERKEEKFDF